MLPREAQLLMAKYLEYMDFDAPMVVAQYIQGPYAPIYLVAAHTTQTP